MKKSIGVIISLLLLLSITLSACNFSVTEAESDPDLISETLVAIAFTQTAMAQQPVDEPTINETTEAPLEVDSADESPTVTPEIIHQITPGEPGWVNKYFFDTDSSKGSVTGGDDFIANLFERPFTEDDMVYRPDVDINKAEMSEDSNFYYVTITLKNNHPDGGLQAAYGIEIDTNRDGRGDLLVIADRPTSTQWDITGASVHKDQNSDVGGSKIMRPDTNYQGDGYEQVVFSIDVLDDPDAAWARISTSNPPSVTIAFKKSLISGFSTFVWGVWSADNLLDPALIDLHDNFTQAEAGSPYTSHSTYPVAALNLVDNTCRETYLFEAETPIPGLCYSPEPLLPTETLEAPLGNITGVAFDDLNNDGNRDAGEPLTINSVTITLHRDSCATATLQTTTSKSFNFSNVDAGSYCVKAASIAEMTTPTQISVSLSAGGTVYVEFGFRVVH